MNKKEQYNYLVIKNNYYPFGSVAKGRSFSSQAYRYGFNGQEKDDEVSGNGNEYDYGNRIYDPRLGRFLSVDPLGKDFAYYTPYQFAGNKVIVAIDMDGLEDVYITEANKKQTMTIVYNRDDVNKTIAGTCATPRIYYNGKQTTQFEGPNKANQEKVFALNSSNIERGIVAKEAQITENNSNEVITQYSKKNIAIPEATHPKVPKPKPADLNIAFKSSSDKFENESNVIKLVEPIAKYMLANPKATLDLSGNSANPTAGEGNSAAVLGAQSFLNGADKTVGDLQQARADAVKNLLVKKYKIDASRINATTGTNNPSGTMSVSSKVNDK